VSDQGIDQLAARFPAWNVYTTRCPDGSPATLMATRRRGLTQDERAAGLAATLPMGFFGDLCEQLVERERLERALGGGTDPYLRQLTVEFPHWHLWRPPSPGPSREPWWGARDGHTVVITSTGVELRAALEHHRETGRHQLEAEVFFLDRRWEP
jgi:hypothetical protein